MGLTTLDAIIGGGCPVSSVVCLFQDPFSCYSDYVVGYFLSEGVRCSQACIVLSDRFSSVEDLTQTLLFRDLDEGDGENTAGRSEAAAAGQTSTANSRTVAGRGDADLSIAWQYEKYFAVPSGAAAGDPSRRAADEPPRSSSRDSGRRMAGAVCSHNFDISHAMQADLYAGVPPLRLVQQPASEQSLDWIQAMVTEMSGFPSASTGVDPAAAPVSSPKTVCRVAVYADGCLSAAALRAMCIRLRAIARSCLAVVLLVVPGQTSERGRKIATGYSDIVCGLESFVGSDVAVSAFEAIKYSGLLRIMSLPSLNSLSMHCPESCVWGFKMRRRTMSIEKLQNPPEESRETNENRPKFISAETSSPSGDRASVSAASGRTGISHTSIDY